MSSNDPNNPAKISPSQRSSSTSLASSTSQRSSTSGLARSPSSAEFVNFMGTPAGVAADQPQPANKIESIRQYYHQLTNNIRLIQQQLQIPDLPPARRQALLVEQARVNAAMQEFTEKILKPITAQKQQQQQQQAAMQNQMRMAQFGSQANAANVNPANQRFIPQPQPQQPQQWTQQPVRPPLLASAQKQPLPARPPAINLSSQVGMGMIRPIMTAPGTSASIPPSPNRYRPVVASASAAPLPPTTPTKAQQLLLNRQSYLQAAHQHQSTIRQQQTAFQQRLAIFSREVQGARVQKPKSKAPVFALPTPTSSLLKSANSHPASPNRRNDSPLRTIKSALYSTTSMLPSGKTSSLPAIHASASLAQLARAVNPCIVLQKSAQKRLLEMADVFAEQLVKQACQLALHRASKGPQQLSVEDVQLALDLTLNYQPAGQGSIENCRPPKKPQIASLNAAESASSSSTGGSLAHHHRMAVIKKHAAIYNAHQGRINEE